MNENENKKKRPYLPKYGSEDPHPLLIPLQNYHLRHDTFTDEDVAELESDFIGRINLINQLSALLENTKNKRGSYLVAGYRGSGKTSLINRVINTYKNSQKNKKKKEKIVMSVHINLGHDEVLDPRHVLFNIISSLKHEFNLYYRTSRTDKLIIVLLVTLFILLGLLLCCYVNLDKNVFDIRIKDIDLTRLPAFVVWFSFLLAFFLIIKKFRGWLFDAILFFDCKKNTNDSKYFLIKKSIIYTIEWLILSKKILVC